MITLSEIEALNNHCINLLSYMNKFIVGKAKNEAAVLEKRLFESIRKLFIASLMSEKRLICISGLQGAGKTMLMNNLYDLNGKYLSPSIGRGEILPIIISEKKTLSAPKGYAITIGKDEAENYCKQNIELSSEEFIDIAGGNGNTEDVLYLELHVPYKYIKNDFTSFMLLPGFEGTKNYWDKLIDFSVHSADAAAFVFTHSQLSSALCAEKIDNAISKFGDNIVCVLSHSDELNEESIDQVKQTCMQRLNLSPDKSDRIVSVGSYIDKDKNKDWISNFIAAIEKYAYTDSDHLSINNAYIYNEAEEIRDIINNIKELITQNYPTIITNSNSHPFLQEFDKQVIAKQKNFKKQISKKFEAAAKDSKESFRASLSDNDSPKLQKFANKLGKGIKQTLFGVSVDDIDELQKLINNAMYSDDNYLPAVCLCDMFQSAIAPKTNKNIQSLIGFDEDTELIVDEGQKAIDLQNDVVALLVKPEKETRTIKNSHKEIMGAVVDLGTYYFSLKSYETLHDTTQIGCIEPEQPELKPDNIISGADSSKRFVAGILGMIGIDAIDNTAGLMPVIAGAFGGNMAVAGAIAAAVISVGAVSVIIKDFNKRQINDVKHADLIIESNYEDVKKSLIDSYNEYMQTIRNKIEENLEAIYGEGKKVDAEYNARIEIQNAEEIINHISGEANTLRNRLGIADTQE